MFENFKIENSLKIENCKLKISAKRGFVALFAVLVSGIVLTISFGLLTIALKEIILSSLGRESQFGFYAADAGAECALYWDIHGAADGSGSVFPTAPAAEGAYSGDYLCNGKNIRTNKPHSSDVIGFDNTATTTFWLDDIGVNKACAKVEVGKYPDATLIQSFGYNTCNFSDPRIIERGILVSY